MAINARVNTVTAAQSPEEIADRAALATTAGPNDDIDGDAQNIADSENHSSAEGESDDSDISKDDAGSDDDEEVEEDSGNAEGFAPRRTRRSASQMFFG